MEECLDSYILTISGPECVKLFEQILQEVRDIIYIVFFHDAVSEVRIFRTSSPPDGSRVSFASKTFDVCRRPGTDNHKWLFSISSANDMIILI
jgi:hypothetical protein